jgi:preprotein translocase subunit SecG
MDALIIVVHIVISLLLVGLILIQHGKGADAGAAALGGGGGASSSVFGSQGSASFLSRASALLAAAFFVTSLSLSYFSNQAKPVESVTESVTITETVETAPVIPAPSDLPDLPE